MDSIYDGSATNHNLHGRGPVRLPAVRGRGRGGRADARGGAVHPGLRLRRCCFDLAFDKCDEGVAGMMAGFILARGGGVGLIAGPRVSCCSPATRRSRDYAGNKERQRIEDEEIDRQLKALAARRGVRARRDPPDEGSDK